MPPGMTSGPSAASGLGPPPAAAFSASRASDASSSSFCNRRSAHSTKSSWESRVLAFHILRLSVRHISLHDSPWPD